MTKSQLANKDYRDLAEDLLSHFPGVDRADLLKALIARYFFEMKHGNKREERAACDFLNHVSAKAAIMLNNKAAIAVGLHQNAADQATANQ